MTSASSRRLLAALLSAAALSAMALPAMAADPADDGLLATLWMQKSIEYKASAMTAFTLARIRLDEGLADKNWTAAPGEQTGAYQDKPTAVVLDVDETLMDNSNYQAWTVIAGTRFDAKTWTDYVNSQTSLAIPGAVEFTQYAASKGVKVFYVTNRTKEEEPSTAKNMEKLGFPMGGNVDTLLTSREQPDWTSAKSTRRAFIAKDYRIVLNVGDNYGDFSDEYRGDEAARLKSYDANKARFGKEWIMLPNPTYGSFESATFNHDFKKTPDEQRSAKRGSLMPWKP